MLGRGMFIGGGGGAGGTFTGGTLTSDLLFSADNTLDIGASGATRPRTIYAGTSLHVADDTDATSIIGRMRIDSRITDSMYLSHFDKTAGTDYALFQTAAGITSISSTLGNNLNLATAGSTRWRINGTTLAWEPGTDATVDLGATTSNRVRRGYFGEYLEFTEMTAPAAPAANKARLFTEDNGAGKTRLVVIFPTGAAQVIATEP